MMFFWFHLVFAQSGRKRRRQDRVAFAADVVMDEAEERVALLPPQGQPLHPQASPLAIADASVAKGNHRLDTLDMDVLADDRSDALV